MACWRRDSGTVTVILCSVSLAKFRVDVAGQGKAQTRPSQGLWTVPLQASGLLIVIVDDGDFSCPLGHSRPMTSVTVFWALTFVV